MHTVLKTETKAKKNTQRKTKACKRIINVCGYTEIVPQFTPLFCNTEIISEKSE